jgi:hypothetical protein
MPPDFSLSHIGDPAGFTRARIFEYCRAYPRGRASLPRRTESRRRAGERSSPDPGDSRAAGTAEVERGTDQRQVGRLRATDPDDVGWTVCWQRDWSKWGRPLPGPGPRCVARLARQYSYVANRRGAGSGARPRRPHPARRSGGHLPSVEQAAAPLLPGERRVAGNGRGVPRPADQAGAVHHRGRRQRRRRQVHHRPAAPGAHHAMAAAPAHRASDDRQLPVPQRGAGTARPERPQGLPRVLRPPGAAALRPAGQGRRTRGQRAGVLARRL